MICSIPLQSCDSARKSISPDNAPIFRLFGTSERGFIVIRTVMMPGDLPIVLTLS